MSIFYTALRTRVLEGFACSRCGAEPAAMVPDDLFETTAQLFRCADGYGCADSVECRECGEIFDGDRSAARRARWEPWNFDTQYAIDHGPMVCSDCIGKLLADLQAAMKAASKAGRW